MNIFRYLEKSILSASMICGLTALGFVLPSQAATTHWQEVLGGKVRLISGGMDAGRYKAGLEIVLDEGWKTYWKVPGDSGIPPLLDSSGSSNARAVEVAWPVPSRIRVGSSDILGYKDAIIFPIFVTPNVADGPTNLALSIQVGLCSDLCVPMNADLSLDIPSGGNRDLGSEMLIDRDLALVPARATETFGIKAIDHAKGKDGAPDRLSITALIPDGYGKKDLFVEGPDDWLLPLTQKHGGDADDLQKFVLPLDGLPKGGQSKGVALRFTLTNGEEAVEQTITLDK